MIRTERPAHVCRDIDTMCDSCQSRAEAAAEARAELASEQACMDRADREARW